MQYEWTPDELNSVLGQRLNKSQGFRPRTKSGISISVKKCKECGLLYSQPQPIPFNIQDHYGTPPENYWKKEYFEWSPNYFAYQIKEVINLIGTDPDKKALDIGAGLGKAMLSLEHYGFDAYGIEPSIPFYERAISEMGVPKTKLKLGAVEEVDFPLESFDFITFGAVFEHLYDPKECLKKALS